MAHAPAASFRNSSAEDARPGSPAAPLTAGTHPVSRVGLIVNPKSGRGNGKGVALVDALSQAPHMSIRVLDRFEQITGVIDEMARDEVSDLFISSGDGTIQEILTQIAERRPFRKLPRISLLPHGTTNLTAADLGLRKGTIAAQAAFMQNLRPNVLKPRHTIRCANPGDGKVRHGMFVGTGAVAEATLYCQRAFNDKGVKGQWATFSTIASAASKAIFLKPDPDDPDRLDRPYDITVEAGGKRYAEGTQLLQMSTTLDKLVLNTKPFWGGKTAPIRTTIFPYPVPSVIRWMLPVMYGSENRTPPPGSLSFCSESLTVRSQSMFVIDGEFFDAPKDGPLRLEAGAAFTFITG